MKKYFFYHNDKKMKKNLKLTFTIKVSLISMLMGYLLGHELPIKNNNSYVPKYYNNVDIGELTNKLYFDVDFGNKQDVDVSFSMYK